MEADSVLGKDVLSGSQSHLLATVSHGKRPPWDFFHKDTTILHVGSTPMIQSAPKNPPRRDSWVKYKTVGTEKFGRTFGMKG